MEARVALVTRRAERDALNLQVLDGHAQLARRTLDRMKQRYQAMAAIEERDLRRAAAREETRADHANNPLERYRASRAAELLEQEARVITVENALTTNPPPSYDQQRALAERARTDLGASKKLLDDGKISHLDALRLNTDFRRLAADRSRIVRRDLAAAADRLTRAENALSTVETELAFDSRDDRFELDNLMERVPPAERAKAEKVFKEFETKHLALLNRRRAALDRTAQRAEQTHQEVLVRLRILDDHFGFIRTHMFWVRDEEPVGGATVAQAQRELRQLGRATVRIGAEVGDRSAWGRLSVEFLAATFGLVALPWPLRRGPPGRRPRSLSAPLGRKSDGPRTPPPRPATPEAPDDVEARTPMRTLRNLLIGLSRSAIWPGYLALAAYAARQAPWPKSIALPAAAALGLLALAALAANLVRRLFGPGGWGEVVLGMPPEVSRMVRRGLVALVAAHVVLLLPVWLLTQGMIAPAGRPVSAPAVVRGLILAFESVVLLIAVLGPSQAIGPGRMADALGRAPRPVLAAPEEGLRRGDRGGRRGDRARRARVQLLRAPAGHRRGGIAGGRGRLLGVLPGLAPVHR